MSTATGQATQWAAYRASRIVGAIPGRPPARLDPPCVNGAGFDHTAAGGVGVTTGAPVGR